MRYFCDAREVFGRQRAQEGFRTSVFLKKLQKIEMICVSQFAHVCLCVLGESRKKNEKKIIFNMQAAKSCKESHTPSPLLKGWDCKDHG